MNLLTKMVVIVFSMILMLMVLSPIFYHGYAIHNDYYIYVYHGFNFPESNFLILIGRPIGAILLDIEFYFLTGLKALRNARIFGGFLLILIFIFTYKKFKSIQPESKAIAWLTALLIILLPGFLLNTIWVADHVPGLIGTLTAIWSYYLVDTDNGDKKKIYQGYAVLFISFLIYPPTAFYFLVFSVWKALYSNYPVTKIIQENAVLVIISVAYYIYAKFINLPLATLLSPNDALAALGASNYSLNLANNLFDKAEVIKDISHITFGLWGADIFGKSWRFITLVIFSALLSKQISNNRMPSYSLTVSIFILIYIILYSSIEYHARIFNLSILICLGIVVLTNLFKHKYLSSYTPAAVVLAAIVISLSPIIVSQTGFAVYRNTTSTAAIVVVIFVWALASIARSGMKYALIIMTLLFAGFLGYERLEFTARNAIAEYNYLKKKVDDYKPMDGAIVIKQPSYGSLIFPYYVYRDFGFFTTNVNAVAGGVMSGLLQDKQAENSISKFTFGQNPIEFIHKFIYPETYSNSLLSVSDQQQESPNLNETKVPIVWEYREENGLEMDNASNYVIDMRLAGFISGNVDHSSEHTTISVSPVSDTPPIYAFEQDSRYFWQSQANFPVYLTVRFDKCKQISGYEFVPWDSIDTSHLPKKWVVRFRNRDTTVVSEMNIENTRIDRFRYQLSKAGCYSSLKFEFKEGMDDKLLRIGKIKLYE